MAASPPASAPPRRAARSLDSADQHLLEHARVHRAQRRQPHGAALELGRSRRRRAAASARTLALLLPRRPRSSSICSAMLAPLVAQAARGLLAASCHARRRRPAARAPRGAAAAAAPPAPLRAPAGGCAAAPAASPSTRAASACARRQREHARGAHVQRRARSARTGCSICCVAPAAGVSSGSASASILFSTTKRASAWPPRWSRQIARSDLVTPVSAPRMKTVACAAGSRPSVSSGSAPMAFRPGVSSTTRPALEQRVRVVDQRMAPGRHLDPAVGDRAAGCPAGARRSRSRARAPSSMLTPLGAHHLASAPRPAVRVARRPAARCASTARGCARRSASDCASQPGVDRQQRQRRRRARRRRPARPGTSSCARAWPAARGGRCRQRRWR